MLVTAAAIAWTLLSQQPVDKPTLKLYQQRFVVRTPSDLIRVPISSGSLPPPAILYRRNDTYAVWDERGLTIRQGAWIVNSRLKEVPVSPKVQEREDILHTLDLVKTGDRVLEAQAISGSCRLGSKVYFLVRWDGRDKKPWFEALVSVDLTSTHPKPKLEGSFGGLSLSTEAIDDRLDIRDGRLYVAMNTSGGWGIGSFDPSSGSFSFQQLGHKLLSFAGVGAGRSIFTEETEYGTTLAGRLDAAEQRSMIFETRGAMRFVDDREPELIVTTGSNGRTLYWADTGAEIRIGAQEQIRRVGPYVLTWSPAVNPKEAILYEPDRWEAAAKWQDSMPEKRHDSLAGDPLKAPSWTFVAR
jgi:hypothetical protein